MKAPPIVEPQGGHAAAGKFGFAAPGTFVLAMFFLAIFVVYYAINWKYLASVWPMSYRFLACTRRRACRPGVFFWILR